MERIKPLGERLLVRPIIEENPLWIGDASETMIRAEIIEVGDVGEQYVPGKFIIMSKSSGVSLQINEVEHRLLRIGDAWAIIENHDNPQ